MIDDKEFQKSLLTSQLKNGYNSEVIILRKQLKTELIEQDKRIANTLRKEIESMQLHDQLLSMSIFPFIGTIYAPYRLGYRFVRAAPLLEKGIKNFDFLIIKETDKNIIVILGEAKSSISNVSQIINEFKDRKKIVEKEMPYMGANYFKSNKPIILEYVLCVFAGDAVKVRDEIEKQGEKIILWAADLGLSDIRLISSKGSQKFHTHFDHDLSRAMDKTDTSRKASTYYLQSHIVTKLESIIAVKEVINAMKDSHNQQFERSDLDFYLKKVLYYLSDKERIEERDHIVKKALDLGLIKFDNGIYQIQTIAKGIKGQRRELHEIWIQTNVKKEHEAKVSKEIGKLQAKYKELNDNQVNLEKFF